MKHVTRETAWPQAKAEVDARGGWVAGSGGLVFEDYMKEVRVRLLLPSIPKDVDEWWIEDTVNRQDEEREVVHAPGTSKMDKNRKRRGHSLNGFTEPKVRCDFPRKQ
jgi:hypothetical protein